MDSSYIWGFFPSDMKNLDLANIEKELKKRHLYPYSWFRKQNDNWDGWTNFIYQIPDWETLNERIAFVAKAQNVDKQQLFQYAANRWYNFWSAQAIEKIFAEIPGIESVREVRDREKDFYLHGIPFDHKTSVFPKGFPQSFQFAQSNKRLLIEWLYKNQSTQKRYHLKNRLFVVVYDNRGEHWKLKAEISFIQQEIYNYISSFKKEQLQLFDFSEDSQTFSDIIWVANER